eukprot:363803-Chlamydomonas_euryale.AAC.16
MGAGREGGIVGRVACIHTAPQHVPGRAGMTHVIPPSPTSFPVPLSGLSRFSFPFSTACGPCSGHERECGLQSVGCKCSAAQTYPQLPVHCQECVQALRLPALAHILADAVAAVHLVGRAHTCVQRGVGVGCKHFLAGQALCCTLGACCAAKKGAVLYRRVGTRFTAESLHHRGSAESAQARQYSSVGTTGSA